MNENYNKIKLILEKIDKYNADYKQELSDSDEKLSNILKQIPDSDPIKNDLKMYINFLGKLYSFPNLDELTSRSNLLNKLGEKK